MRHQLTSEIVAFDIFEKPHPLIQPTQPPSFLSLDRTIAGDASLVLQLQDLWHRRLAPGEDLCNQVPVIPNDPPAISRLGVEGLIPVSNVHHCLFPDPFRSPLGSPDQLLTFCGRQDMVEDASIEPVVVSKLRLLEVDDFFFDLGAWTQEKVLGQLVRIHGGEVVAFAFGIDVGVGEEVRRH